jgi:hypothetical protein
VGCFYELQLLFHLFGLRSRDPFSWSLDGIISILSIHLTKLQPDAMGHQNATSVMYKKGSGNF